MDLRIRTNKCFCLYNGKVSDNEINQAVFVSTKSKTLLYALKCFCSDHFKYKTINKCTCDSLYCEEKEDAKGSRDKFVVDMESR
jgi:hypothetical protein